jgi:hypothetical protein
MIFLAYVIDKLLHDLGKHNRSIKVAVQGLVFMAHPLYIRHLGTWGVIIVPVKEVRMLELNDNSWSVDEETHESYNYSFVHIQTCKNLRLSIPSM